MKMLSLLELLQKIDNQDFQEVLLSPREGSSECTKVLGVTSNASRFNFSLRCIKSDGTYRNYSLIKDGEISKEYKAVFCTDSTRHTEVFNIQEMPIIPDKESILEKYTFIDLVSSLLLEYRVDEKLKAYRSLKNEFSPKAPREYSERSVSTQETPEVPKKVVPCVTYQIQNKLESTVILDSIRESCSTWEEANSEFQKYDSIRNSLRLKARSLTYLLEESQKDLGLFENFKWTEVQPLPRSKKKSFQETTLCVYDEVTHQNTEVVIRRIFWDEEVEL